jgi:hypothetical protein
MSEIKIQKKKQKFYWKRKSNISLRNKTKLIPRSPGECSQKSENILESFALSQNQIPNNTEVVITNNNSEEVIPATQFSNPPVKQRKRGRKPKPKADIEKLTISTQTSPQLFQLNERHVRKLSKKMKMQFGELKGMLQRLEVDSESETSAESVISCSQKSVQLRKMYAHRRVDAIAKKNADKIQEAAEKPIAVQKSNSKVYQYINH